MNLPTLRLRPARRRVLLLPILSLLAAALPAAAQLRVEITGVGSNQFPIAVAKFQRDSVVPQDVDAIVRADLERSGVFRLVEAGADALPESAPVNLQLWKASGADALVVGSIHRLADGRFDVRFRLYDAVKQQQVDALAFVSTPADLRLTAHRIADRIYEKLTGAPGVFSTRIAYVVQLGKNAYELQIADADGANPQTALRSREPIMSPSWAPDGVRIAYVSFEQGRPIVYVHALTTGERRAVASFRGNNSAPAWSPDGKSLAVALSRDGITQIYLLNLNGGGNAKRLTNSGAIDTEPHFSPDAKFIYFTSDRGGGPQIYRMDTNGGSVQRVTFNGDYNVSPRVSPDGRMLAYVSRRNGRFQVQTLDMASGQELTLTDTALDESPSFAPNGRLLLYATEVGRRGVLASVAIDARARTRLSGPAGDVREPTWGPFIK
ncbi:MAG TPA: Tol-Pal system beta propeller repeat protein TolB [Burkholderiaceae bacterium]|nr:Tol-Pal system beta propeller repeat protein TolB [Burkholderiaceae bacterium]